MLSLHLHWGCQHEHNKISVIDIFLVVNHEKHRVKATHNFGTLGGQKI